MLRNCRTRYGLFCSRKTKSQCKGDMFCSHYLSVLRHLIDIIISLFLPLTAINEIWLTVETSPYGGIGNISYLISLTISTIETRQHSVSYWNKTMQDLRIYFAEKNTNLVVVKE